MPRRRSRNNRVYAHGDPGGFDSDNADDADLSDAVDAYAEQYELAIERRGAKHGGGGGAVGALVRNVLSAEDADELARNLLRSYVKDARAKERVRARERSDRARRMAATAKREAQATDEAEDRGKVHRKAPPLSHMHRGASRAGTPSGAASRAAGRAARARDTAALGSPAPARRCASGERAFSHAALEEPAAPAAVDDGAAAGSSGALVFGTLEPGVVEWSMGLESALDSAVAARRAARSAVVGGGEDGPLRSSCADTFQAVEPEGTLSRRVSSGGLLRSSSGNKAAAASSAGSLQDEHETRARSEVLAINSQLKIFKAPPADAEKAVSRLLDHWESLFGSAAEPAGRGREWVHLVEKDAEQNVQALREWARLRNAHEALRKYAMTMEARAVVLDGSGAREMPWPSCGDALASLLQLAEEAVRARDAAHAHALRALRLDPIDVDGLQTALAPLLIAGQLSALAAAKRCRTLARHADTEAMMSGFSAGAALALSLNEVRPVVDGAADLLSLSANLTDIPGGVSLAMAEVMDTSQPLLKKAIADALRAYAEALRAANGAAVAARPGGRGALDDYLFCQHVAKTLPGAQIAVLHDFVPVACQLLSRVGDKVVVPLERPDSPRQAANAIAHASENLAAAEAAVAASQNLSEQLLKSYSSMARSEMSALREATTDASERVETVCELVARKVLDFHSIYLSVAGGGAEQLRAPDGTAADVLLARSLSLALKITGGPFSDEDRFDRANISLLLWCCSAAEAAMADLVRSASRAADGVGDTGGPTALGQSLAAVLHTHVASSVATLLEFGNNITQQSSNPVFYDYSQRGRAGDSYQRHGQRLSECFGRLLQAYAALPMLAAKILGASEPALLQQLDAADAWTVETLSLDVISFALDLFEADFMSLLTKQFAQVRADVAEVADMLPALRRGREDLQRSLDNLKSTNATSAGADLPGPVGSGSGGAQRKAADASNAPAAPPGSAREDSLAGLLKASASSSSLYTRYAEPTNWEIRRDDLNIISEVKGSRGQVFTAYFDHMTVAVKSLASGSLGALSEQQRQASANEVMLMRSLNHENLVRFYGVGEDTTTGLGLFVVMEFCKFGSLHAVLKAARTVSARQVDGPTRRPPTSYPEKVASNHLAVRLELALGAAKGMAHLHQRHLWHRDLKSPNILVSGATGSVSKVADYGYAVAMGEEDELDSDDSTQEPTNARWLSPERMLLNSKRGLSSDIWAFGVCLWECLTMESPWEAQSREENNINSAIFYNADPDSPRFGEFFREGFCAGCPVPTTEELERTGIPAEVGEMVCGLIAACFSLNPKARPKFPAVVEELQRALRLNKEIIARKRAGHQRLARRTPPAKEGADRAIAGTPANSAESAGAGDEPWYSHTARWGLYRARALVARAYALVRVFFS